MSTRGILLGIAILIASTTVPPLLGSANAGGFPLRLAQRWDELSPEQKSRAMENYQRHKRLSPEKQRDVEQHYRRWQNLPSTEKDRIRQRYREDPRDRD